MVNEEKKYQKVLNILRKSKPVLKDSSDIEANVMRMLQPAAEKSRSLLNFLDYLFGWVYIGWVRKGFIAASILIIGVFTYQQSLIIRRIDSLEKQTVITGNQMVRGTSDDLEEKMFLYKLSGIKLRDGQITISEKQMEQLIDKVYELQTKYKYLIKMIENNPELKQFMEMKLSEKNKEKLNL